MLINFWTLLQYTININTLSIYAIKSDDVCFKQIELKFILKSLQMLSAKMRNVWQMQIEM